MVSCKQFSRQLDYACNVSAISCGYFVSSKKGRFFNLLNRTVKPCFDIFLMFLAGLRFFTCYDNNVIRIINMFMKMKTRNSDQCLKNVKFSLVLTVNHDLVWPSTV